MGWVESAPYFCAASETARDIAVDYIETQIGALPKHKFDSWAGANETKINTHRKRGLLRYLLKVYVDNFIVCIILTTKQQVEHIARAILHGIHDVFPPSANDTMDPISGKKLRKGKGTFAIIKCLLGFEFNGINKTIWLEAAKRASILMILHQWISGSVKA